MNYDVLFNRPDNVRTKDIDQKKDDVNYSAKATLVSGTLTGLAICLEFSIGYAAILAVFTVALISCWHNESKRLAIMKTIPVKDDSDSTPSQYSPPTSPLSPDSPIHTPTRRKAAISAPPTKTRNITPNA